MSNSIYPLISLLCFIAAIVFFRKRDIPIGKVLPFLIQSMSPHKMVEVFEKEGIWLIVGGFIVFLAYMIFT